MVILGIDPGLAACKARTLPAVLWLQLIDEASMEDYFCPKDSVVRKKNIYNPLYLISS